MCRCGGVEGSVIKANRDENKVCTKVVGVCVCMILSMEG